MLGKPKFTYGDVVEFRHGNDTKTGIVAIVDRYGTWEDGSDVSYDILNKDENILYKHFREDYVIKKIGEVPEGEIWNFNKENVDN